MDDDDFAGDLWRAAQPGRRLRTKPASDDRMLVQRLTQPGRRWLEYSVMLSALALLFPVVGLGAVWTAVLAIRAGCQRGWAAFVASVWCLLLGVAVRSFVGFGLFP